MGDTTGRLAIPQPFADGSDFPADVPYWIRAALAVLDPETVVFQQGTNAARLAAAHQTSGGRFWWATDTSHMWYDDGAAWHDLTADLTTLIAKSIFTAKGSLITATAAGTPAEFTAGADGTALIFDSTQASGLRAGPSGPNYARQYALNIDSF